MVYSECDWNMILMSWISLLLFNCDSDDVMKIVMILLGNVNNGDGYNIDGDDDEADEADDDEANDDEDDDEADGEN